ncbi:hypothetical protein [Paenibacillus mucilaginosus]|uniref:hypothetical protein n=1 Tax=Paenibacillus mucilaginosus TaxID=61624 RepID=UPI00240E2C57|nr:hypothetical protein [Paenibacillus mucilaginosus]
MPSAYRTLLQEAVAEKREGRLAKQLEEQTAELAKRQSEHEALERRRAELKERRALEAQRRSPAAERLAALRGEAVRTEQWLAAAAARVPVETARLRREQQQAELGVLAAQLAAHLHEGEACPVCGAVEHPAPAGRGADGAGHAQAIEAWEQLEFPLREKMTAAARQLMALQAAAEAWLPWRRALRCRRPRGCARLRPAQRLALPMMSRRTRKPSAMDFRTRLKRSRSCRSKRRSSTVSCSSGRGRAGRRSVWGRSLRPGRLRHRACWTARRRGCAS